MQNTAWHHACYSEVIIEQYRMLIHAKLNPTIPRFRLYFIKAHIKDFELGSKCYTCLMCQLSHAKNNFLLVYNIFVAWGPGIKYRAAQNFVSRTLWWIAVQKHFDRKKLAALHSTSVRINDKTLMDWL